LLKVPIIVDGQTVNWIESKALFGDEETHASYIESQLHSYWHWYGPGMVIYWDGFVEEIHTFKKYSGVIVRERTFQSLPVSNFGENGPLKITAKSFTVGWMKKKKMKTKPMRGRMLY